MVRWRVGGGGEGGFAYRLCISPKDAEKRLFEEFGDQGISIMLVKDMYIVFLELQCGSHLTFRSLALSSPPEKYFSRYTVKGTVN